ncbi:hypothetical protein D3C80_417320 [compost metagenome]
MAGAADQHVLAVRKPLAQHLVQRHHLRHLAERQHVHVERQAAFKVGEAEQRFHQQRRIDGAALRHQHDAHVFGGFVSDILEQRQFAGEQQLGDLFDQPRFLHLERDFGDDDLIAATSEVFRFPFCAHAETTAPGLIGIENILAAFDDHATGRQVRAGNEFHQLFNRRIGMLDEMERRVAKFVGVVRRDRCRHADGDA